MNGRDKFARWMVFGVVLVTMVNGLVILSNTCNIGALADRVAAVEAAPRPSAAERFGRAAGEVGGWYIEHGEGRWIEGRGTAPVQILIDEEGEL